MKLSILHTYHFLLLLLILICSTPISAAHFNIEDFGATPNDQTDDTEAIRKALSTCNQAQGGEVFVPAGTYLISRQGSESPILEIPSNTHFHGEGAASVLKFDPKVNQSDFWRMLGAGPEGCQNVSIHDLHLDGSNTFKTYEKGKTPEHNQGVFFYSKKAIIENVTIRDCLVENFSGDGIGLAIGCRNITVSKVTLKNFVRQGIQMSGGDGARDYLVTGCQDLEGDVVSGGSTIHVEHANGLKGVQIIGNRCRRSILAGGVDGIIIRNNLIQGRIVGNRNSNAVVAGNIINGDAQNGFIVQLGYSDGLILKDNIVNGGHDESEGIYVWGNSRYNPVPGRNVIIQDNLVCVKSTGILLNGVANGKVSGNLFSTRNEESNILQKRSKDISITE